MLNKSLELFEEITRVNDAREMSELEIAGAIAYVYSLTTNFQKYHFGECWTSFSDVDGKSYYCNKTLQLNDNRGYVVDYRSGQELVLDHVFTRENSKDTLWGYAYWYDMESEEESDMFLVRI